MSAALINFILTQINISILPVILLPVTGLSCLVFYNRLGGLNGLIHTLQRDLRTLLPNKDKSDKDKEAIDTLYAEYHVLLKRAHYIKRSIKFCFIALFLFAITAITVIASLAWPVVVLVTLGLWTVGALFFAAAIANAFIEIHSSKLHSMHFETKLIEQWMNPV